MKDARERPNQARIEIMDQNCGSDRIATDLNFALPSALLSAFQRVALILQVT